MMECTYSTNCAVLILRWIIQLLIIVVNDISVIVESMCYKHKQLHNRKRPVVAEACDLWMALVFSARLLILFNMDPRHFCFN